MIVIYRACSTGNPDKERPIRGKINLVSRCFKSFLRAFEGVEYDFIALLDKPNSELRSVFEGYKTEETYYSSFTEGNVGSFHRQIELGLKSKDDFLFVEDDYLWLPESGKKVAAALKELPFITPYDHPRYYDEEIHQYPREVEWVGNHHWADIMSTTLTFGGQYDSLKRESETMKKYGWADHDMWCDITQREKLYAPIPTLATHMETPHLANGVDWNLQT